MTSHQLPPSPQPQDVHSRIRSWTQSVASATEQLLQSGNKRNLRPRRHLTEISSNPRPEKRALPPVLYEENLRPPKRTLPSILHKDRKSFVAGAKMSGQDDEEYLEEEQEALENKPKRGRGRPRGREKVSRSRDEQLESKKRFTQPQDRGRPQMNTAFGGSSGLVLQQRIVQSDPTPPGSMAEVTSTSLPLNDLSDGKTTPASTRKSQSRGRKKRVDTAKADAAIDMAFLATCRPSVKLRSRPAAKKDAPLPDRVEILYNKLQDAGPGYIPHALKVCSHRIASHG